jgi:hypothetical protein
MVEQVFELNLIFFNNNKNYTILNFFDQLIKTNALSNKKISMLYTVALFMKIDYFILFLNRIKIIFTFKSSDR